MKLVLFLLDAFRTDYITEKDTPFLYKCSKEGRYIKRIKPSAGFCERTEIFTGLKPSESGYFTAIGFDPDNSPYKDNQLLKIFGKTEHIVSSWIDAIFSSRSSFFKQLLRRILVKGYRLAGGKIDKLKLYSIPLSFLPYFCLTEDAKEIEEQTIAGVKSIFEILRENGEDYFLDSFTSLGKHSNGSDVDRLRTAVEAFGRKNFKFIPIYIGKPDSVGHRFGPGSNDIKQTTIELDKILQNSAKQFLAIERDTVFMFLGDHGMSDVTSHINIKERLNSIAQKNKLKPGSDFIYFLDSTMFRIWFITAKAKNILEPILIKDSLLLKHGRFINGEIAEKYYLPESDRRYGDLIWWADTGVLIFPDFFHSRVPYKAMHGYPPEDFSTFGTCLIWGANTEQIEIGEKHLYEVYNEIKHIIEN